MSLAIKYENVGDAKMRLQGTVVLYKGQPVLIKDVQAGAGGKDDIFRVFIQELPVEMPLDRYGRLRPALENEGKDVERKFISSKHFDIAPFKMGYVNSPKGNGAFYCTRMPNRVQKQGLCTDNFKAVDNLGVPVPFGTFLACKEVNAMVANEYPNLNAAIRSLDKVPSVAFTRDFAVMRDEVVPNLIYLYHKGKKVGMYTPQVKEVSLGNKFNCLKESIEEMRIKVGVL